MTDEYAFPYIDPNVQHRGVSWLRKINLEFLRRMDHAAVLQAESGAPLAVVLPYEIYMRMQNALMDIHGKAGNT